MAANLRALRKVRGMSTYEVARRLTDIGWPIAQTGVARIETGQRRVDVDDLLALASVLDVSPNRLMLPLNERALPDLTRTEHTVIGNVTSTGRDVWRWATGDVDFTLSTPGRRVLRVPRGGSISSLWQLENRPGPFPSSVMVDGTD